MNKFNKRNRGPILGDWEVQESLLEADREWKQAKLIIKIVSVIIFIISCGIVGFIAWFLKS